MSDYIVARGGPLADERVTADRCSIDPSGALVFNRQVPHPPHPPRTELVQAYAAGRWVEVLRVSANV